jgi:hypothetical protein
MCRRSWFAIRLIALVLLLSNCAADPVRVGGGESAISPPPDVGSEIRRQLEAVEVIPRSRYQPGYVRACDPGACVFGDPWTDDHGGAFGRNGCDTRQDVLLQQMSAVELRWGSACRIFEARLDDPYSGQSMTWRSDGYQIQVDHIYPLAAAWHAGAWRWTPQRRTRFANDIRRELLAVSATANQAKGAQTPSSWLPPGRSRKCDYVKKYLAVALAYDLPVTADDAEAMRSVAAGC